MAITVAGVTSKPNTEYTPAVITTSWTRAISVGAAIIHSKRKVMYSVTSTRNTIRARIAFWLISWPHDGPTSLRLTRLMSEPVVLDSASVTWSLLAGLMASDLTFHSLSPRPLW